MDKTVLAVDIGTSSIKTGIIDRNGFLRSWQRTSYEEVGGSIYNWKTDYWVDALKKALSSLPYLGEIDAAVFSGSGPTIVPIDSSGNYISESLLWLDSRKTDLPGEKSFFLPKIMWFEKNMRNSFQGRVSYMPLSGFFPYLLTGEFRSPVPNSEFAGYIWSDSSIDKLGLDRKSFPEFTYTGQLTGYVSEKGSSMFGIRKGVPVFAGANDYLMALLGTGAVFEGAVCDRAGTSEGINYCSHATSPCENLRALPHIIEGFYNISGVLASSGKIFEWFRKLSGHDCESYMELVKEISRVIYNDDRLYFFPSLKRDSVWQFSGGAFVGLEARHGKAETGSAVLKSIGFSVREVIKLMESCGFGIEEIRLSGGQAKNPLWNQMKSSMIGKKLLVPEIHDGELLGCACAGFMGLGLFRNLSEASASMVRIREEYTPDMKAYRKFTQLFEQYSAISLKMETLASAL